MVSHELVLLLLQKEHLALLIMENVLLMRTRMVMLVWVLIASASLVDWIRLVAYLLLYW